MTAKEMRRILKKVQDSTVIKIGKVDILRIERVFTDKKEMELMIIPK